MDQKKKHYPQFLSGQVLRSSDLNDSFDYVDEQIRITRANFIGYGILDGLDYEWKYNRGKLVVSRGIGVTPDGEYIQYLENKIFTDATYSKGTPYKYILFESEARAREYGGAGNFRNIPLTGEDMSDFIIAIAKINARSQLINCGNLSCDLRVTKSDYEYNPVLIPKTDLDKLFTKVYTIDDYARLQEFSGYDLCVNINVYNQKAQALYKDNRQEVLKAFDAVNKALFSDSKKQYPCWGYLLNSDSMKVDFNALNTAYTKLKSMGSKAADKDDVIPLYYYQYLEDVASALNEFIAFYNGFVTRNPWLPNYDFKDQSFIVLGDVDKKNVSSYHSFWQNLRSERFTEDCAVLTRMITRICRMSHAFLAGSLQKEDCAFKCLWQYSTVPLGKRPVPYYYAVDQDLAQVWDPMNVSGIRQVVDYADEYEIDKCPLPDQLRNYDLLTLQGHLGKNVYDVKKQLEEYIDKCDLNIEVKLVEFKKKKLENGYTKFLSDALLSSKGVIAIGKAASGQDPQGKTLGSNILQTTKQAALKIKKVIEEVGLDRLISDIEDLNHTVPLSRQSAVLYKETFKNISYTDVNVLVAVLRGYATELDKVKLSEVDALSAFITNVSDCYDGICRGARSIRGCKRNSTLFLFHYNERVILDVCRELSFQKVLKTDGNDVNSQGQEGGVSVVKPFPSLPPNIEEPGKVIVPPVTQLPGLEPEPSIPYKPRPKPGVQSPDDLQVKDPEEPALEPRPGRYTEII